MPKLRTRSRVVVPVLLFGLWFPAILEAGINTWTTSGPESGRVEQIVVDPVNPSNIYVLTPYGGVFKTANGGVTWRQANRGNTSISAVHLAIDPRTPTTLYVAAQNQGVFKTVDSAERWRPANVGLSGVVVLTVAIDPVDPQRLYAGTADHGVYKSSDGGESWTPANQGLTEPIEAIAVDPAAPTTLYAAALTGLFKSLDAGATWSPSGSGLTSHVRAIQVHPQQTSIVYAGTGAGVFKSVDSGGSWVPASTGLTGDAYIDDLAIDPRNGDRLMAAQRNTFGEALFLTTNGGLSWTKLEVGLAGLGSAAAFHPLSSLNLYAGVVVSAFRGTFLVSGNGGQTWAASNLGLSGSLTTAVATDFSLPGTAYAAQFARVYKTADRGATWTLVSTVPAGVGAFALDPARRNVLYAATGAGVFKSTDGGSSWTATNSGLLNLEVRSLGIDRRGKTLYAGTNEGVFRSTNAGVTWNSTGALPDADPPIAWTLAVHPVDPMTVYARCGDGLAKSTDGGGHWTRLAGAPRYPTGIAIDPSAPQVLYAAADLGAFKSSDGGETWKPVNLGLPDQLFFGNYVAIDRSSPSTLYFSPFVGAFRTTDGAEHWSPFSEGDLPWGFQTFGLAVSADSKTIYAATYGGVYWYTISAAAFYTLQPCRLVDTRGPADAPPLSADSERTFVLASKCGVPPTAKSVALNITVVQPTATGHLTVYETGTTPPGTFSISFSAGRTRANNAIVRLDPLGRVTVKFTESSGTAHFLADVSGYFE